MVAMGRITMSQQQTDEEKQIKMQLKRKQI